MPTIVLSLDGQIVQEHVLTRARTTIGRRPYHDIVIDNLAVSGDHAVILRTPKGWMIEDLGSTNGTLFKGEPITRHLLKDGDLLEIGRYRLRFLAAPETPREAELEKTVVMRSPFAGKSLAALKGETSDPDAATEPFPPTFSPELSPRAHGGVQTVTGVESATHPALLRVLSGPDSGREIPLDKPIVSLGKPGVGVALITRKPLGYFLAHVDGDQHPLVNGSPINDKPCPLNHHDLIQLGPVKLQFCLR
ncbi:MAG: FHA domain-containing protein [Burkholderiales bacterium]|nr:FHA domain-containing protein [Burkholderiales bacterium]